MYAYQRLIVGVLGFFIFLGLPAGACAAGKVSPDLAAIEAVDQAWSTAYNAGNALAMANLYANDAVLLPPGAPGVRGRALIHAFFERDAAALKGADLTFHLGPHPDAGISGNLGWCSGTYSVTDKAGQVIDVGKYLSVSRKQGGKWLHVRDTWNSDVRPQ